MPGVILITQLIWALYKSATYFFPIIEHYKIPSKCQFPNTEPSPASTPPEVACDMTGMFELNSLFTLGALFICNSVHIYSSEMKCTVVWYSGNQNDEQIHVEDNDGFDSDDDVVLSHVANKLQGM